MVETKDRHHGGCFYCGSPGPFTDEHVISAGLGGDDPSWMLRECVCKVCNTERFSPLESHLLKESHISVPRLFLQASTRDRKSAPSIQPRSSYFRDPRSGLLLVAELRAGGESHVVPQVVLDERADDLAVTGTPGDSTGEFLERLRRCLDSRFDVIQKEGPRVFSVAKATWSGNAFQVEEWATVKTPPEEGIWLEELPQLSTPTVLETPPRSVHQRRKGQLICRSAGLEDALGFLEKVRQHLDALQKESSLARPQEEERPTFHLGMNVKVNVTQRAITKIGLNITAHICGLDFVRRPDFDDAVNFVVNGSGAVPNYLSAPGRYGPGVQDRHVLLLFVSSDESCGSALMLAVSLYGSDVFDVYRLALFSRTAAPNLEPVVIHVDYNSHKIELMDLVGHAQRVAIFDEPDHALRK